MQFAVSSPFEQQRLDLLARDVAARERQAAAQERQAAAQERQATALEQLASAPTKRKRRAGDAGKIVREFLAEQRRDGVDVLTLTRDGIAAATDLPTGTVSGTRAFQALQAEKRQARSRSAHDAAERFRRAGDRRGGDAAVRSSQNRRRRIG